MIIVTSSTPRARSTRPLALVMSMFMLWSSFALYGCGSNPGSSNRSTQTNLQPWDPTTPAVSDGCYQNGNFLLDSDGDRVCDDVEIANGMDPGDPDTDGDGVNDAFDVTPLENSEERRSNHLSPWAWAGIGLAALYVSGVGANLAGAPSGCGSPENCHNAALGESLNNMNFEVDAQTNEPVSAAAGPTRVENGRIQGTVEETISAERTDFWNTVSSWYNTFRDAQQVRFRIVLSAPYAFQRIGDSTNTHTVGGALDPFFIEGDNDLGKCRTSTDRGDFGQSRANIYIQYLDVASGIPTQPVCLTEILAKENTVENRAELLYVPAASGVDYSNAQITNFLRESTFGSFIGTGQNQISNLIPLNDENEFVFKGMYRREN